MRNNNNKALKSQLDGIDLSTMNEFTQRIQNYPITKGEILELIKKYDTKSICSLANTIRNTCKNGPITYSRKVFINLINLCRDTCSYCTYKKELSDYDLSILTKDQALRIARLGKRLRCTEALIVTGERPEQKYPEFREWLKKYDCSSTTEYIEQVSNLILEETGLLPHTNAGTLNYDELSILKKSNVSLGCMLETSSKRLSGKNMPHEFAPSKNPRARIRVLENAGKLKIPITTGLLIGIGETLEETIDSLIVIREINRKYGNIQEIIMQNHVPKYNTKMRNFLSPSHDLFLLTICLARIIMPNMNIQVPPNLSPKLYSTYINAGINDWGGISPLTIDFVNPESPWPDIKDVKGATEKAGYRFRGRLAIYPEFILNKREFIPKNLWSYITPLTDSSGLVKEELN
ncbi:MAG TPA: 7,8-didemethyl-8-hydroxy-5-deazariboflavin synthase CofG [Nitrososphaeraceae archaeon]|nr:7,8-didemethyl-8-hydroxy-5-deazariboflavin synthase CofG [Nitrososphaeraceae archaeon]